MVGGARAAGRTRERIAGGGGAARGERVAAPRRRRLEGHATPASACDDLSWLGNDSGLLSAGPAHAWGIAPPSSVAPGGAGGREVRNSRIRPASDGPPRLRTHICSTKWRQDVLSGERARIFSKLRRVRVFAYFLWRPEIQTWGEEAWGRSVSLRHVGKANLHRYLCQKTRVSDEFGPGCAWSCALSQR